MAAISFISPFASHRDSKTVNLPAVHISAPPSDTGLSVQQQQQHKPKSARAFSIIGQPIRPSTSGHFNTPSTLHDDPTHHRRMSVDAALLLKSRQEHSSKTSNARRGSKRLRDSKWGNDDEDEAEDSSSDLVSASNSPVPGRPSIFSDHLTAILSHSLSLASGQGETSMDLFARGEISPVSTPAYNYATSPFEAAFNDPAFRIKRQPSVPNINSAQRKRLIILLQDWSFDALSLDADELYECACIMFESCVTMRGVEPGVPFQRIRDLILALRSAYHARNGYHNFAHATDVLQAVYSFLDTLGVVPPLANLLDDSEPRPLWRRSARVDESTRIGDLLRPMDVFSLMIAAIGHDVGHPGLSNAYMVNAKTPVAQVYADKSVLENFHTVTLMRMLRQHGFGHLFGHADCTSHIQEHDKDCRRVLYASILATDMSRHFSFVAKLQETARRLRDHPPTLHEMEADRLLICSGLMKCADISNPSRPHEIAQTWSTALLEEWRVQAEIEEEFDLPVSVVVLNPLEKRAQAKSQVGFINLFTLPLFDAMASGMPQFERFAESCREGRRVWENVLLQGDDEIIPMASTPSIDTTPRASQNSQMNVDNVQSNGAELPRSIKRKSAPRALNLGQLSSSNNNRASLDSTMSSASSRSPSSPIFSPKTSRNGSAYSSSSSFASSPNPRTQCTGICGSVTAKCSACLQREIKARGLSAASNRQSISSGSGISVSRSRSKSSRQVSDLWPPYPFRAATSLL